MEHDALLHGPSLMSYSFESVKHILPKIVSFNYLLKHGTFNILQSFK